MIIDFEKIAEIHQEGFKGGKGLLDTRNYVDEKVKIMYSTLRPGASSGLHTHEGNCEVIFLISDCLLTNTLFSVIYCNSLIIRIL